MTRWTEQQVVDLAPDAKVAAAGRGLARPGPWSQTGATEALVYGRCQGSGREPYQVTVDLNGPAFRCTCPSRKFPCKHGVALLLLWARGDGSVTDAAQPEGFAADWAQQRAARSAPRPAAAAPADPEARERRERQRAATMDAGAHELARWLVDLVDGGIAGARRQPYAYYDAAAARLVDAQLPGLAERVRALGESASARTDWVDHLLRELARLWLAAQAWPVRAALPAELQADLRTYVGWPRRLEDVLAGEVVEDTWAVLGAAQRDDERLQSRRTWLAGRDSGRTVLVLDFAAGGASLPSPQRVGALIRAPLALYPGSPPQRAAFAADAPPTEVGVIGALPGGGLDAALDTVSGWSARNPWAERLPIVLAAAVPVVLGDAVAVVDALDPAARRLPVAPTADPWRLLALSGGRPVGLVAEWTDDGLAPMACSPAPGELVTV